MPNHGTTDIWNRIQNARNSTPAIMGILNVTPDSFSDGGAHSTVDAAVSHALKLEQSGADILDIGGESTRPGSSPVSAQEELDRVIPVIEGIRKHSGIPISLDTQKAAVVTEALRYRIDCINDISAMTADPSMRSVAAESGLPVILMHMQGTPTTMQDDPVYSDVVTEVQDYLVQRADEARQAGITRIVLDPGIGFGKRLEHNLVLLAATQRFALLDYPILIGTSRKGFIGEVTGLPVERRIGGTVASVLWAAQQGASIVRVHDVEDVRSALQVFEAIRSHTQESERVV